MKGETDGFPTPIGKAVKRTDAESAETRGISAFRCVQAPVEITLWSGGVDLGVDVVIVSFLVNNEAFGAGVRNASIFGGFHWADFERNGRESFAENASTIGEVIIGDKFGMFAGDEEDVAKTVPTQFSGFGAHFGER